MSGNDTLRYLLCTACNHGRTTLLSRGFDVSKDTYPGHARFQIHIQVLSTSRTLAPQNSASSSARFFRTNSRCIMDLTLPAWPRSRV